jgi:cell division protein FtsX
MAPETDGDVAAEADRDVAAKVAPEAGRSRPVRVVAMVGLMAVVAGAAFAAGYLVGRPGSDRYSVTVYLDLDTTDDQRQAVKAAMEDLRPVDGVRFQTRAEAWEHFQDTYQQRAPEIVDGSSPDSLPESFRLVTVRRAFQCSAVAPVRALPGVDQISIVQVPTKTQPGATVGC